MHCTFHRFRIVLADVLHRLVASRDPTQQSQWHEVFATRVELEVDHVPCRLVLIRLLLFKLKAMPPTRISGAYRIIVRVLAAFKSFKAR